MAHKFPSDMMSVREWARKSGYPETRIRLYLKELRVACDKTRRMTSSQGRFYRVNLYRQATMAPVLDACQLEAQEKGEVRGKRQTLWERLGDA